VDYHNLVIKKKLNSDSDSTRTLLGPLIGFLAHTRTELGVRSDSDWILIGLSESDRTLWGECKVLRGLVISGYGPVRSRLFFPLTNLNLQTLFSMALVTWHLLNRYIFHYGKTRQIQQI